VTGTNHWLVKPDRNIALQVSGVVTQHLCSQELTLTVIGKNRTLTMFIPVKRVNMVQLSDAAKFIPFTFCSRFTLRLDVRSSTRFLIDS
jgi:hypothetical protein